LETIGAREISLALGRGNRAPGLLQVFQPLAKLGALGAELVRALLARPVIAGAIPAVGLLTWSRVLTCPVFADLRACLRYFLTQLVVLVK
jgi:hypothetical protein